MPSPTTPKTTDSVRYGVAIRSWRESLGGEHYYGEAWRWSDDGIEKREVLKTLSRSEAIALNKKDRVVGRKDHRPGDQTNRFATKDGVFAWGALLLKETYGADVEMVERGAPHYDNPAYPIDEIS